MGWNGNNGNQRVIKVTTRDGDALQPKNSPWMKGLVAGGIVVVGAVLFYFVCCDSNPPQMSEENPAPVKSTARESAPTVTKVPEQAKEESPVVAPPDPNKRYEGGVEVVSSNVTTNNSGAVIEKLVLANGKKMSKIHPPKPVFDNPCDQVIALAISTKPGQSMPPLPNLDSSLEKEFLASLEKPFKIEETDSEQVRELKARVLETKAYLAEEIKNGGSVLEALREHQRMMDDNADAHLIAVQQLQKVKAEYGQEAADEFLERVNETLRARGLAEIEPAQRKENRR